MFTYILESTTERRTRRDNDIKTLFHQLTIRENLSFMEAYEAVGYVFYLSADHVQKILRTHYQSQAQNFCIMAKKKQRKRKEPKVKEKKVGGGRVYTMPLNPQAGLYHHHLF